jgi:hypothetical protein
MYVQLQRAPQDPVFMPVLISPLSSIPLYSNVYLRPRYFTAANASFDARDMCQDTLHAGTAPNCPPTLLVNHDLPIVLLVGITYLPTAH